MRSLFLAVALIACPGLLLAQDDAPAPTTSTEIRLPNLVVPPMPQPVPPNSRVKFTKELYFVIDSDTPCLVLASPLGLVSISSDEGPIKVRGRFIDGAGTETRTFKGPYVYTVEAQNSGDVEILVIPEKAKEADVLRRSLRVVVDGVDPQPQPDKPDPMPEPTIPDGKYKMAASVVAWAGTVTSPNKKAEMVALSKNFAATSSKIAANAYASSGIDAMLDELATSNRTLLKTNSKGWEIFMTQLSDRLDQINPKSLAEYQDIFTEMVIGFSLAK